MPTTPTEPNTAPTATSTYVINTLLRLQEGNVLTYRLAQKAGRYTVTLPDGTTRAYATENMARWLHGYLLGRETSTEPAVPGAPLAELRPVLVDPSLTDGCRIALLAAMESAKLTPTALARLAGVTPKTVASCLRLGTKTLSMVMAQRLMTACGGTWEVRYRRADATAAVSPLAAAPAEPVGLRRLRGLALFHERGLVRLISPTTPGAGIRASSYVVARAGIEHEVRAPAALLWLTGLGDAVDPVASQSLNIA